jgi:predicted TPR repeat methyltransferase
MRDVSALLRQAVALHQQGRLEQARALYQQVLAMAPQQFDALHLSGVIARQQGDPARAVDLIRAALRVDASQARAHSNLGAALQDLGQPEAALHAYDSALRLDPGYALAWNNRGNTLRRLGRPQEALDSYERALALQGAYPEAWCHRAIALNDLGRHLDAAASAEQALAARPGYADALLALGNALQGLERFSVAVDAYDRALALLPSPETWCARGAALKKSGDLAQALDSYDHALLLRPDYALAAHYRANVLRALGRREDAIGAYRRAHELGADPAAIDFALAALGEGDLPSSAPPGYIKELFDQYAGHFDRHLVGVLDYRTPELLGALLRSHIDACPSNDAGPPLKSALDLGCGTGLCGPFLRPLAQRVAGVDLSGKMLQKAGELGYYDELVCSEIVDHLIGENAVWDLVLAADVFVYFGDLATVFQLVRQALRPGGLFAFSIEALAQAAEQERRYALAVSGRFAHAPGYVQSLATNEGFAVVEMREAPIRAEHGAGVDGYLFLLRAPGDARTAESTRLP